jgi:two-component system, chemotaxis family, CheB/CheR fusion protein
MPDAITRMPTVLVVEDNLQAADSLALFLRYSGYEVRVAHNGAQALESARLRSPDAVLCDIRLPDMDGFAVAGQLRAQLGSRALLIAVTAYAGADFVERARAAGFDRAFAKPLDPFELERLIQAHEEKRTIKTEHEEPNERGV